MQSEVVLFDELTDQKNIQLQKDTQSKRSKNNGSFTTDGNEGTTKVGSDIGQHTFNKGWTWFSPVVVNTVQVYGMIHIEWILDIAIMG